MHDVERRQPVQQAGGEHDPGGARGQGRGSEIADLVDQPLRDRRLLRLGDLRGGVHDLQPLDRGRRRAWAARRASRTPCCRARPGSPDRGSTPGSSRPAARRAARRGRRASAAARPRTSPCTTSLTETPKAFFTALTWSSATLRKATRRCGVIGLLNGVAGARPGTVGITAAVAAAEPEHAADERRRPPGARVGSSAHELVGHPDRLHRPPGQPRRGERGYRRDPWAAFGPERFGSAAARVRSGARSSSTVSSSAPDAPSIAEWWILV